MKDIHKKRLLKLAKHLRSGRLGHKKFCFSKINADSSGCEMNHNGCGSLGCAVGECPIAFPRQWRFKQGQPVVIGVPKMQGYFWGNVKRQATAFFGIDVIEVCHLFQPYGQRTELFGGRYLTHNATVKQVAANIEAFVKRKEKEA